MLRPTVWLWDNSLSQYTDLTDNIRTDTDFNFISDANDKLYFGLDVRAIGLYSDLTTAGSYTGITYEFIKSGETWQKMNLLDSYAFSESKYQRWTLPNDWIKFNFTSTTPHAATPPDTVERYWFRVYASAVTTTAVFDKVRIIPYVQYTTAKKVSEYLELEDDFDLIKRPTTLTVEDIIRRKEDRIDYKTKKSWRFNAVVEDTGPVLVDFNRYGFYPRHRNFIKVYSVKLWNGNSFDTLTDGRNNDYFVNYDLGIIYMTRMFMLPALYGMVGRYTQYTFGEFKFALQVDYIYGKDSERDPEFFIVEDLATKMTAIDLLTHHDYSNLVVSGSDKVGLESKVNILNKEIDETLESLCGVQIF